MNGAADITLVDAANAIAAYEEAAYRADNTPFDQYLRGDLNALTQEQIDGMNLFYGSAGCSSCHSGNFLTDHAYHGVAMPQIGPGIDRLRAAIPESVPNGLPLDPPADVCPTGCAHTSIAAALNAASIGDEVTVANGLYNEKITAREKRTLKSLSGPTVTTIDLNLVGVRCAHVIPKMSEIT